MSLPDNIEHPNLSSIVALPPSIYNQPLNSIRNEIRLLSFDPLGDDGLPCCTLRTVSLDDQDLKYNALSYCWGEPVFDAMLHINCIPCLVTRSVYEALERAHTSFGLSLPIWVDQLCINQADDAEKSEQVLQMTRIYSNAQRCLCYLGSVLTEEIYASHNMDHLFTDGSEFFLSKPWTAFLLEDFPESNERLSARCSVAMHLLLNDYFKRTWVIQECAVAKTPIFLTFEGLTIPFECLGIAEAYLMRPDKSSKEASSLDSEDPASAVSVLTEHWNRSSGLADNAVFSIRSVCKYGDELGNSGPSLIELLKMSRLAKASDLRDKLFALVGIASDKGSFPAPDYSWSLSKVFFIYAYIWVMQGFGLDCLELCTMYASDQDRHSWIPTFANAHDHLSTPSFLRFAYISPVPTSSVVMGSAPGTLQISCTQLGAIVFPENLSTIDSAGIYQARLTSIFNLVSWLARPTESAARTWARISDIIAMLYIDHFDGDQHHWASLGPRILCPLLPQIAAGKTDEELYSSDPDNKSIDVRKMTIMGMKNVLEYWQIVSVSDGQFGAVTKQAKKGDSIIIIDGALPAAVVREVDPGRFRLIGKGWLPNLQTCNPSGAVWNAVWKASAFAGRESALNEVENVNTVLTDVLQTTTVPHSTIVIV